MGGEAARGRRRSPRAGAGRLGSGWALLTSQPPILGLCHKPQKDGAGLHMGLPCTVAPGARRGTQTTGAGQVGTAVTWQVQAPRGGHPLLTPSQPLSMWKWGPVVGAHAFLREARNLDFYVKSPSGCVDNQFKCYRPLWGAGGVQRKIAQLGTSLPPPPAPSAPSSLCPHKIVGPLSVLSAAMPYARSAFLSSVSTLSWNDFGQTGKSSGQVCGDDGKRPSGRQTWGSAADHLSVSNEGC